MIQRIQTILLALILFIVGALFFLPVYNITVLQDGQSFITFRELQHLKVLSLSIIPICLLALIAIFMYKNRKRQLMVVNTGLLLSLALFVLCISLPNIFASAYLFTNAKAVVDYGMGVYLMAIIPALFFFAGRRIKKDEELVKAADRLR
jgi:hypothetical protein